MKTIYLQTQLGWEAFDYESACIGFELKKRNIYIADNVNIVDNVKIGDGVVIGYGVVIADNVKVGNGVKIGHYAVIGHNVKIGDYVKIGHYGVIGNDVKIGNSVVIGDGLKIENDVEIVQSIHIAGSKHAVNWYGNNTIKIGCLIRTIAEWKENFMQTGLINGYSKNEVKEYKKYIDLCAELQRQADKQLTSKPRY